MKPPHIPHHANRDENPRQPAAGARTAWWRNDSGSIPFAMLVVVITIVTSATLVSALAWQSRAAGREQARQDARWAADSATSLALEDLSAANNLLDGIPVLTSIPATLDDGPPLRAAPEATGALRWFVLRGEDANDITVLAEGRTLDRYPVAYTNYISMRYDYTGRGWVAYRISSSIDTPVTPAE